MTGTNCDLFTHKSSQSYLNRLVNSEFQDGRNKEKRKTRERWSEEVEEHLKIIL
jgi:hypothetical protein